MKKQYKDSVFTRLFSDEHRLRELYNALAGANYGDDVEIVINTLEDVLYGKRLNDISFTIGGHFVVLIEHQSTINRNMPLRFLLYIARVYEKFLGKLDKDAIFREKMILIPIPELYVAYNGPDDQPDYQELKLSDMFVVRDGEKPVSLELTVKIFNIRKGQNPELLAKSETLRMYAEFVAEVEDQIRRLRLRRPRAAKQEREKVLQNAIEHCINNGVLSLFLQEHASEVVNMLTTEWNWKRWAKINYEEAYETIYEKFLVELPPELTAELTAKLTPKLTTELTAELTPKLTTKLTAELTPRLTAKLTTELTTELTAELTAKYEEQHRQLQEEIRRLETELRQKRP